MKAHDFVAYGTSGCCLECGMAETDPIHRGRDEELPEYSQWDHGDVVAELQKFQDLLEASKRHNREKRARIEKLEAALLRFKSGYTEEQLRQLEACTTGMGEIAPDAARDQLALLEAMRK